MWLADAALCDSIRHAVEIRERVEQLRLNEAVFVREVGQLVEDLRPQDVLVDELELAEESVHDPDLREADCFEHVLHLEEHGLLPLQCIVPGLLLRGHPPLASAGVDLHFGPFRLALRHLLHQPVRRKQRCRIDGNVHLLLPRQAQAFLDAEAVVLRVALQQVEHLVDL